MLLTTLNNVASAALFNLFFFKLERLVLIFEHVVEKN